MVPNIQREVIRRIERHCWDIGNLEGGRMSQVRLVEMQYNKGFVEKWGSFK